MKPKTVGRVTGGEAPHTRTSRQTTGIVAGSLILTAEGEMPVEYLAPGDRVISRMHGMMRLRSIRSGPARVAACALQPGALGPGRPATVAMLPAAQTVLVRDWRAQSMFGTDQAIAAVGKLIDGEHITDLGTRGLRLVHLRFERATVIYADGVEIALPHVAQGAEAAA